MLQELLIPKGNITLCYGELSLQISPELGGSILGFEWNNKPLLRPTIPQPNGTITARQSSSFPLIPFSNRIANAAFDFMGKHYELPRDPHEPRHALHGNAFCAKWDVIEHNHKFAQLFLEYRLPRKDIPYFPFAYDAWQNFILHEHGLTVEMKLKNCSATLMPAGMGHHFYFPLQGKTKIKFNASNYWENDETMLPLKPCSNLADVFSAGEYIGKHSLDNCFEGWQHFVKINSESQGYEISIKASNDFSYAVLYTPPGKDYFAFEPVTHLNNAINMPGQNGLRYLEPGETWQAKLDLILTPTTLLK